MIKSKHFQWLLFFQSLNHCPVLNAKLQYLRFRSGQILSAPRLDLFTATNATIVWTKGSQQSQTIPTTAKWPHPCSLISSFTANFCFNQKPNIKRIFRIWDLTHQTGPEINHIFPHFSTIFLRRPTQRNQFVYSPNERTVKEYL